MALQAQHDLKPPLCGVRILVAEDDVLISMELESILMDAGAEIIGPSRTVKAALALSGTEDLRVALLDLQLGPESILPVARDLSQRGIPIVLYTGQVDLQQYRTECPNCKILSKPAPAHKLVKAIADALCPQEIENVR